MAADGRSGTPPAGMPPPFRHPGIGGWLRTCRNRGAGDRGVDVGPGRAPGALAGVAAAGRARRGHRGRRRRRLGRRPAHRAGGARRRRRITDTHRGPPRQRPVVGSRAAGGGGEAPRGHRDLPVPRGLLDPGVQPAPTRRRQPVVVPGHARVDPDPHRRTGGRTAARSPPCRRDRRRREHPRPVRPRHRVDDGPRSGGRARRGDPAAVRARRRSDQLPGADDGRRHREVGVERSRVDAVERLLREVRQAHAQPGQRVREPARRTRRHPRVQRRGEPDLRPPGERRVHLRPLRHPQGPERHRSRARRAPPVRARGA